MTFDEKTSHLFILMNRNRKLSIFLSFLPLKAHQMSRELTHETDLFKTKISDKNTTFRRLRVVIFKYQFKGV